MAVKVSVAIHPGEHIAEELEERSYANLSGHVKGPGFQWRSRQEPGRSTLDAL